MMRSETLSLSSERFSSAFSTCARASFTLSGFSR
jgi:hypothetical protein